MKRIIGICALALHCSPLYAGKTVLMPELGRSELDMHANYSVSELAKHDVGVTINFLAGYKFSSNVIVAATHSYTDSNLLFGAGDHYQLYDIGAVAGYSFDIAALFRIVPMVGWSYWKLQSTEGELFNPGPEERFDYRGNNFYWRLNIELPISSVVQLNLAYVNGDYDFGRLQSKRFGVKFEF